MARPVLFVGLGGTGGKTVRYVAREAYRRLGDAGWKHAGTKGLPDAWRFIHVDDLCAGIVASLGRTGFEVFNLAGDGLVTLGDVLGAAQAALGVSVKIEEKQPSASSIRNPLSEKAYRELGWRPRIPFADGVRRIVAFLQERNHHA